MPPISACPAVPDLQRLLLGQLPDREAEDLELHLLQCNSCLQTLKGLPANDTLVEAFRAQAAAGPRPPSTLITELIRKLEGLRPPAGAGTTTAATGPHTDGTSGPGSLTDEAYDFLAPPQGPDELGRLGPYRVLRVLGAGGMGVVFRAEDPQLRRPVALKAMKPALAASAAARRRFLREAQTAAAIKHDHIVTIYQVGEDRSIPFLAMELLDGETLEDRLRREGKLPPAEVLRLGREAAEGLAAAHERGLVHRDIKPGNLWLEARPGEPAAAATGGRVKILDFGLARAAKEESELTGSGVILGTPAYMAPEQARGETVDHRADLFSLGCLLYRCCTGRLPFSGTDNASRLLALQTEHPAPPRQFNPEVPPALNTLILRLLAKSLPDRPSSARAVVEALAAMERPAAPPQPPAPEPRPPRPSEKDRGEPPARAVPGAAPRRRRLGVLVAAGLLLLIGGGVLLPQIIIRIKDRAGKTVAEVALPEGGKAEAVKDGKVVGTLPGGDAPNPPAVAIQPEPLPPLKGTEPLSPLALVQRPAEIQGVRSWTLETIGHRGWVGTVAFSPDGRLLASGGDDGSIRVWKADSGQLHRVLVGHGSRVGHAYRRSLAWSPDGRALASGGADGTLRVWQVESGRLLRTLQAGPGRIDLVLWSPDGKQLASGAEHGPARLWDAATGKLLRELKWEGGLGHAAAWSPDGKVIASLPPFTDDRDKVLRLWDVAADKLLAAVNLDGVPGNGDLAWSHDGKTLAFNDSSGRTRLLEGSSGRPLKDFPNGGCPWLFWMPGDKELLLTGSHGEAALWQAREGKLIREFTLPKGDNYLGGFACSPDGKVLAAGDDGGAVRFWDAEKGDPLQTLAGHADYAPALAWSPDGRRLMRSGGGYELGGTYLWDVHANPPAPSGRLPGLGLAWSPDGQKVVVAGGNDLGIRDARTGQELKILTGHTSYAYNAAWSPDGRLLASGGRDNTARLWDPASGKLLHTWDGYKMGSSLIVSWSPDGKRLATGGDYDNSIRILDVETGKPTATVPTRPWGGTVVWSPDGKKLATGGDKLYLWDTASGQKEDTYDVPPGGVVPLAWLADGSLMAVTYGDRSLRVWNASGRLARAVRLPASGVLSPDRRLLASLGACATWVWDVESGRCRGTLVNLRDDRHLVLSADGHYTGSPRLERDLVCVVETEQGQATLSPDEFAQQYGWKNDPDKARLAAAPAPAAPDQPAPVAVQTEPLPAVRGGEPLSPLALVSRPEAINGVRSWTIETRRHRGPIGGLAYSPDGGWLATPGDDGTVRLWEPGSGRLVRTLLGHGSPVTAVAWSPDSETLASAGWDQTVRLWRVASGTPLRILQGHEHPVMRVAWSPDGKTLASVCQGGSLRFWDAQSGKNIAALHPHPGDVHYVKWSPDGKTIATATDKAIHLWDVPTGQVRYELTGHPKRLDDLAWSPDGEVIATVCNDATLRLWAARSGKLKATFDDGMNDHGVLWSQGGKTVIVSGGSVKFLDAQSGQVLRDVKVVPGGVGALAGSPDGKTVAAGGDGSIYFWDAATGRPRQTIEGHPEALTALHWSPDGRTLLSGTETGTVRFWDAASGRLLRTHPGRNWSIQPVAWSPDSQTVALGSSRNETPIQLLEVRSGKALATLEGHENGTISLAWSLDGKRLASGGWNGTVRVSDATSGKTLYEQREHKGQVFGLAWSHDSTRLASAGEDSRVRLWDAAAGKCLTALEGHERQVYAVSWSPDGKTLASGGHDKTVRLWDTASSQLLETLRGHEDEVHTVAWSPDGKTVMSVSGGRSVRLWEGTTGRLLREVLLKDLTSSDTTLWMLADGPLAARAIAPQTVRLWETGSGQPRGTLVALRNFQWLAVGPGGHYRGSGLVERELVYVVQTEQGQETLTPEEFAQKYGWTNDPDKVRFAAATEPAPAPALADAAKPFALLGADGKPRGEFAFLWEALNVLRDGDTIEVQGNGPFQVGALRVQGKGFRLRAAAGYRPVFVLPRTLTGQEDWLECREAALQIEGCDFRCLAGGIRLFRGGQAPWEIRGCRFVGVAEQFALYSGPKLRVADCLIVSHNSGSGFVLGPKAELELTNNVLDGLSYLINDVSDPGGQKIRLENNTIIVGTVVLLGDHKDWTAPEVKAVGNLLHVNQAVARWPANGKELLQWQGRHNLYAGPAGLVVATADGQEVAHGLAAWNRFWGREEEGSQEADQVLFQSGEVAQAEPDAALQALKRLTDPLRQRHRLPDLGPDWDLVGPGEAYIRALAAAGTPVPKDRLRPPATEEGPFVLVRAGKEVRWHPTLQHALDAAVSGDTVEVRTDGPVSGARLTGKASRALTVRAAPGYRPTVEGLELDSNDALSVEGLHFRTPDLGIRGHTTDGGLVRLANCSFETPIGHAGDSVPFRAGDGKAAEIVNCYLAVGVVPGLAAGRKLLVRNSVLGGRGGFLLHTLDEGESRVELDRCVVWSGVAWAVGIGTSGGSPVKGRVALAARGTVFKSEDSVLFNCHGQTQVSGWQGSHNVYLLGQGPWFEPTGEQPDRTGVEAVRRCWNSPEDGSAAGDPPTYDPQQWRLLPSSPGQGSGPGGRDVGADVDRVARPAARE